MSNVFEVLSGSASDDETLEAQIWRDAPGRSNQQGNRTSMSNMLEVPSDSASIDDETLEAQIWRDQPASGPSNQQGNQNTLPTRVNADDFWMVLFVFLWILLLIMSVVFK